ncbi:MAG: AIR synthase-related protein [Nitrososphaerales archaeon]
MAHGSMKNQRSLDYASVGIDRDARAKLRRSISKTLDLDSAKLNYAKPLVLPFNRLYRYGRSPDLLFDLQAEEVGTKCLLAELDPAGYSTIGIDGVAMVVNDLVRSGSKPLFLSDVIDIAKSRHDLVRKLIHGVRKGAKKSGALLVSGETGDAREILHKRLPKSQVGTEPFSVYVAGIAICSKDNLISGKISDGDEIIGIRSSGIHSNGLTLARRILLKSWGGRFDPEDQPEGFSRPIIKDLLVPTRIYVKCILSAARQGKIKAAVHVTGDGFRKFERLGAFQKPLDLGFRFENMKDVPSLFGLIYQTARKSRRPISAEEMYRTFNMGYGFAVIVGRKDSDSVLDLLNKYHPSKRVGRVVKGRGVVIDKSPFSQSPMVL